MKSKGRIDSHYPRKRFLICLAPCDDWNRKIALDAVLVNRNLCLAILLKNKHKQGSKAIKNYYLLPCHEG
jgi:hypothetical protein